MRFLDSSELTEAFALALGLYDEDMATVQAAVRDQPQRMRRIFDMMYLLYDDEALVGTRGERPRVDGKTPLELLAQGHDGIERLDTALSQVFHDAAPRDLFPADGQVRDFPRACQVIYRLIWERMSEPGEDVPLHHPLAFSHQPLGDPSGRLAKALLSVLQTYDGRPGRRVLSLAMLDPDPRVRRAAVKVAGGFIGFRDVADAVHGLRDDDDREIRLAALEAFAPFVSRTDAAGRLVSFVTDPDRDIRARALELIKGSSVLDQYRERLVPLAFDPAEEIRLAASDLFDQDEVESYVGILADRAAAGQPVEPYELRILAREPAVSDQQRSRAFQGRLAALKTQHMHALAMSHALRALGFFDRSPQEPVWREVRAIAENWPNPAFERSLLPVLRKFADEPSWQVCLALLSQPVQDQAHSMRAGLAETAADMAAGDPERAEQIARIARDKEVDAGARGAAMWGAVKCLPENLREAFLTELVGDPSCDTPMVRNALKQLGRLKPTRRIVEAIDQVARSRSDRAGELAREMREQLGSEEKAWLSGRDWTVDS